MPAKSVLDDGEAKTCATRVARPTLVNPIKPFGQPGEMICRNPDPRIPHKQTTTTVGAFPANVNLPTFGRVVHGVIDEVTNNAAER